MLVEPRGLCLCPGRLLLLSTWADTSDPGQQGEKEKPLLRERSHRKSKVSTTDKQKVSYSSRKFSTHTLRNSGWYVMAHTDSWDRYSSEATRLDLWHTHWILGNPFSFQGLSFLNFKKRESSVLFRCFSHLQSGGDIGLWGKTTSHMIWTLRRCFKIHGCSLFYSVAYLRLLWS